MNIKSIIDGAIKSLAGKKVFLLMALFGIALLAILFQKSCGGGYDSPEYLKLKGRFEAHKEEAEQKEKDLLVLKEITAKENTELRDQVDKLEIEKGLALADTAEANKKIFEKDRELAVLQEREVEIEELPELVTNLKAQIFTLQGKITLKDEAAIGLIGALAAANKQIKGLEGVIFKKDKLIEALEISRAAERVARMACEDLIKVGEKNTFIYKLGKLAGNGFKYYGIYSAGRDLLKAAK